MRNLARYALALAALTLAACSAPSASYLSVDISERKMRVIHPERTFSVPVSTAARGIGGRPGSNRTPVGSLYVGKRKIGRYGPTVEIHGTCRQGYEQRGRYIQIHAGCLTSGSRGCVRTAPPVSRWIYENVELGTRVVIQP